jgi:short-subunit dehydrogenase
MTRLHGHAGRVVVVIGAANGIGAATVRRLAAEGAVPVLADLDEAALAALHREIVRVSPRTIAVHVDVRDPTALAALQVRVLEALGRVDTVVNCAAIVVPGDVEETGPDSARRQVDINLLGTIYVTQAFLPVFRRQTHGHFIHIASLGGFVPMPHEAVYSATKFAVRGFCRALALELRGSGIRVSAVCPDSADTQQLRAEAAHETSTLSFTSAPLTPDQVARAIVRTIARPRPEVLVPGARGVLVKWLAFSPRFFWLAYPVLDRIGQRGRQKYNAARRLTAVPPSTSEATA